MKLSVIIVNYNVRYFLEQCLLSVQKAIENIPSEVFVVDNNSVDGSVEMVAEKFSWVTLIANRKNLGFSGANNQAMRIATGEYMLLLNPDTVVEETTFQKVIGFMDSHSDAGGLGVKMVDGKGNFLPESKRGLPTPTTAFFKISGISKLFATSKKFNRYYLGNLAENETNEIEILSGAFMMIRKKALDQVGLFDEAFFMYGEDIDLSWRIKLGGWKNYYFPEARIIHYKGESTKKGSLNYVYVFYNAMVIFAQKHFSPKNAKSFSLIINIAIWFRAALAITNRFMKAAVLPFADAFFTLLSLYAIKEIYADATHKVYNPQLVGIMFSSYTFLWFIFSWLGGGYDKPIRPLRIVKPIILASLFILLCYALLPESLRFSRALILFGAFAATIIFFMNRVLVNLLSGKASGLKSNTANRYAIVGSDEEIKRISTMLTSYQHAEIFVVKVAVNDASAAGFDGHLRQLDDIIRIHKIDQVVFCARDISSSEIITAMSDIENKSIEFKIAPPESYYIIGSNSIETGIEGFIHDINSVSKPINRRMKRTFDLLISLAFLVLIPMLLLIVKNPLGLVRNIFYVLLGYKTWVGYSAVVADKSSESKSINLPRLKAGVLNQVSRLSNHPISDEYLRKLNVVYAKDYRVFNDLAIVLNSARKLGD